MDTQNTSRQLRYLEEVRIPLHRAGFGTLPLEGEQLPVLWNGTPLCRITGKGSVFYRREDADTPQAEDALYRVEDIAAKTLEYRMTQGQLIANAGEIEATRICYNALLTAVFEREQLILLLSNDKPLTSVREAWQAEQAENYDMEFSHTILRFCEDIRQAQQPEMTM